MSAAADDRRSSGRLILWSRLLTHSGDQAWDFAVPLALVGIFPAHLDLVALYYLLVRIGHTALVARVCALMDGWSRLRSVRVGITAQTAGVALATVAVLALGSLHSSVAGPWMGLTPAGWGWFAVTIVAGLCASLGAALMDVVVSQDWIPTVIEPSALASVNARLKQIDLGTELSAPVLAGVMLAWRPDGLPLAGFLLICGWNLLSFVPEYLLLRRVLASHPTLARPVAAAAAAAAAGHWLRALSHDWRAFLAQPAALSMIAYSCLWLTVLSPHGVLLTAWLKTSWGLSEPVIGVFRGLGAVFGLLATLIFPWLVRRLRLTTAASLLIGFEALCLIAAGFAFADGQRSSTVFLAMVLLSRIGLYGFILGETEIRQTTIPAPVRGRINGFAGALNGLATLAVYGAGSLLGAPEDFKGLVYGSVVCVAFGALIFVYWAVAVAPRVRLAPGTVDGGT